MNRYIKNQNMLSAEENLSLRNYSVAVVGCGGLGGYLIEMLARLGVGHITAIDGDVFDVSNLNRQLLSIPDNLGKSKAVAAKERVLAVNPEVVVNPIHTFMTKENAAEMLAGHHVICDALDNITARLMLQEAAENLAIPLVHAAIAGWYAQVCAVFPGDNTLRRIYPEDIARGEEAELGNPSFTPGLAASVQVSEVLKILIGRGSLLRNKLLVINTLDNHYFVLDV